MYRIVTAVGIYFLLACDYSNCQPVLSVQSFDYIWRKDVNSDLGRSAVIITSDDEIKHHIENSFAHYIQQRWNIKLSGMALSVKPLSFFSDVPKFRTKIRDKQDNTWYLFLQIFDRGNTFAYDDKDGSADTKLQIKCKVTDSNDSVIFNRFLLVTINREKASPDQVVLKKLLAYPSHFVNTFDSIAYWLFQTQIDYRELWLKPACIFSERKFEQQPLAQLEFKSDDNKIDLLSPPKFSFNMPGPSYTKTSVKKNAVGNTVAGALTALTGIGSNKTRTYEYNADFPFEMQDSVVYHCIIHYMERQSADNERVKADNTNGTQYYSLESGSYGVAERGIDSSFVQAIMLGSDTVAKFNIEYVKNEDVNRSNTHFWDGNDTSTIMTLPPEWDNVKKKINVTLSGQMGGVLFSMRTTNDWTAKEFYIDTQPALIIYGENLPGKALLFQPLSPQQIKLFTMLASLPFSYFNYAAGE